MQVSRTVGRTDCTKTIIHISQNKRGVAATLAYTYVGLTYVNNVVATIVHRYYFVINMKVTGIPFIMTISRHVKFRSAGKLDSMKTGHILKHFKALICAYVTRGFKVTIMLADNQFEPMRGNLASLHAQASHHISR